MSFDKYKPLDGGLEIAVLKMDVESPIHELVLGKALREAVAFEAGAHDSNFDAVRFDKIIKAVKSKKIEAWFMLAGWENCIPKILSAAIDFPTVLTRWEGGKFCHYPAKYREDTSFLPNTLRELIAERPDDKSFPQHVGLGEYFEQETMRIMATEDPTGRIYRGRVAEYSPHSLKMIKLMGQIGAELGKEETDGVLEIENLTPNMKSRWLVDVETGILTDDNGGLLPHVFVTNWTSPDGKQKIAASFTQGISTFTGDPITRVQLTSNGDLPDEKTLQDVLASLLKAGEEEIIERRWNGEEGSHDILGRNTPTMRVHVMEEPEIGMALKALGAKTRSLGPHNMLPVILDVEAVPYEAIRSVIKTARPHGVYADMANAPYFKLAA